MVQRVPRDEAEATTPTCTFFPPYKLASSSACLSHVHYCQVAVASVLCLAGGCALLCASDILSLASLRESPGFIPYVFVVISCSWSLWLHQLASTESHYHVSWRAYCVTVYLLFKLCGISSEQTIGLYHTAHWARIASTGQTEYALFTLFYNLPNYSCTYMYSVRMSVCSPCKHTRTYL